MPDRNLESEHDESLTYFKAGDRDGLLSLYEHDATFVTTKGESQSGKAVIREALHGFPDLGGDLDLKPATPRNPETLPYSVMSRG